MAEKYFPFNSVSGDREYYAEDFAGYFADIISSGVSANGDNLPVTAAGGLALSVGAGFAWIRGHLYENTATKSLTVSPGGSLPRVDRVVARLDVAERKIETRVVQGTAASSPAAPALVRNADYWDIGLAEVSVAASAISLTNTNIKDTRADNSVCGVVRCLVEKLDVGDFMKNCEADFWEWFANLQYVLDGDVAGHLQNQIDNNYTELKTQVDDVRKDLEDGVYSTTAIVNVYTVPNAAVTMTLEGKTLTATANSSGLAVLYPNVLGTWSIKVVSPSNTYNGTIFVENIGIFSATFPTLANMSWADINRVGQTGAAANVFKRGDTKSVTINGESIVLRLEDFEHDDLAAGGKAKMTFLMQDLLKTTQQMNTSNTNVGSWNSSAMRSRMSTYLSQLPTDLRAVIKPVTKKTTAGNQSTSIQSTTDSLWIPSMKEVGLLTTDAGYSGEGTQYPLFTDNASRIKKLGGAGGSANGWWTRSPNAGNATNFRYVISDGSNNSNIASTSYGVCLGLCV